MPRAERKNIITVLAMNRGTTRYFMGLVASVVSASICSVTRMVPSSAAMDAPALPATMRPVSTGPSSRVMESETTVPISVSAPNRLNPV